MMLLRTVFKKKKKLQLFSSIYILVNLYQHYECNA